MDKVLYEKKGEIAYITLNRPKAFNSRGLGNGRIHGQDVGGLQG